MEGSGSKSPLHSVSEKGQSIANDLINLQLGMKGTIETASGLEVPYSFRSKDANDEHAKLIEIRIMQKRVELNENSCTTCANLNESQSKDLPMICCLAILDENLAPDKRWPSCAACMMEKVHCTRSVEASSTPPPKQERENSGDGHAFRPERISMSQPIESSIKEFVQVPIRSSTFPPSNHRTKKTKSEKGPKRLWTEQVSDDESNTVVFSQFSFQAGSPQPEASTTRQGEGSIGEPVMDVVENIQDLKKTHANRVKKILQEKKAKECELRICREKLDEALKDSRSYEESGKKVTARVVGLESQLQRARVTNKALEEKCTMLEQDKLYNEKTLNELEETIREQSERLQLQSKVMMELEATTVCLHKEKFELSAEVNNYRRRCSLKDRQLQDQGKLLEEQRQELEEASLHYDELQMLKVAVSSGPFVFGTALEENKEFDSLTRIAHTKQAVLQLEEKIIQLKTKMRTLLQLEIEALSIPLKSEHDCQPTPPTFHETDMTTNKRRRLFESLGTVRRIEMLG